MIKEQKPRKKDCVRQYICSFHNLCDRYDISYNDPYTCIDDLAQKIKAQHGKFSTVNMTDYLNILYTVLFAPLCYFNHFADPKNENFRKYIRKKAAKAALVMERSKADILRSEQNECQATVAAYALYNKRMFKTNRKKCSNANVDAQKLSSSIIFALKCQFAKFDNIRSIDHIGSQLALNSAYLDCKVEQYKSLFNLLEQYLPRYIGDGYFFEILPYFLFFHFARVHKLFADSAFEMNEKKATSEQDANDFLLWTLPVTKIHTSKDATSYLIDNISWNKDFPGGYIKLYRTALRIYNAIIEALKSVFDYWGTQTFSSYFMGLVENLYEPDYIPSRLRWLYSQYKKMNYGKIYFIAPSFDRSQIITEIKTFFDLNDLDS